MSSFGFLMAAIGSAIGLGNLWAFPYKMGKTGGFAFLVLYLILVALVGVVGMLGEFALGRKTGKGAGGAYAALGKKYSFIGWMAVISPFLILSFYAVLGGMVLRYCLGFLVQIFGADGFAGQGSGFFGWLLYSGQSMILFFALFLVCTMAIVMGGVQEQTAQCLKNIKAVLTAMDVPFDDIVKVTVFLKDLGDVEAMNEIYKRFFPDSGIARAVNYLPARTVVEVADLPQHALVQIEAVCSHGDGTPPQAVEARHGLIIEANNIANAPKDELSSQTVAFSHYNNISAQLGVDPATGALVAGGVKAETEQALKNIKAIIESVDHVLEDCVKVNIFVKDMNDMDAVNEVYAQFFPEGTPARRVVGVANLPMGAAIQIDAIFGNFEGTPPIA